MAESGMTSPFGDGNGGSRYAISKKKQTQIKQANEKRSGRNVVSKSCLDIAIMTKVFTFGVFFSLLFVSFVDGVTFNTFIVGNAPRGIDVDSLGNIWTANNNNGGSGTVTKLAPNGTTLGTFTVGDFPQCLIIDNQNQVWITDQSYDAVFVLDNNGTFIKTITVGIWPYGIATDKSGDIWVVNRRGNNVMKLSSSNLGTILGTFTTGNTPEGIAFDSNNHAWVTNGGAGTLTNLDNNGNLIGTFTVGSGETTPVGVAVDSNDDVWAVDYNGQANAISVYKFSNDGIQIGSYPAGNNPNGIAIDSNNDAWITNYWDSTVTKLSNSGVHLATYNVGTGSLFLAFDLNGNAWITNSGTDTVTEIEPNPTSAPTSSPTTKPTTAAPTTPAPTTNPTTSSPTTLKPTTPAPITHAPTKSPTKSPTTLMAASLSSGAILGLAIGIPIAGISSALMLAICLRRRRKLKEKSNDKSNHTLSENNVPLTVQVDATSQKESQPISVEVPNSSKQSLSTRRSAQTQPDSKTIQVPKLLKIKSKLFILKEKIGSGGFSQVFKVEYIVKGKEREIYAFKQFPGLQLDGSEADKIKEEIEMLSLLEHPNIIKLIGVSDDADAKDANGERLGVGIVMEYCENGSWRKILDKNPFPNMDLVNRVLLGVANGMNYLHHHEPHAIIHRDLKSDNILLDKNMNAKICDFGLSKISETISSKGKTSASGAGTMQYKAPETFEGRFGLESDVYAFGCVIFESLSGKRPWGGLIDAEILKKILIDKDQLDFSHIRPDASSELTVLMKQCLDYQKEKRPSFAEIRGEVEKLNPQKDIEKKYLAFVSHHKISVAASLATNIKKILEESQQQTDSPSSLKVFVDQEEQRLDLSQLLIHLEESKVVILLLTKDVLHRPYCLLELNHAVVHKIPIVTVLIEGEGYDYQGAKQFLTYLDSNLDKNGIDLIKSYGVDVLDIAYHLSNIIPNIIANRYNFKSAERIRKAQMEEIVDSVHAAQFNEISKSKQEWLASRPKQPSKGRGFFGTGTSKGR